MANTAWNRLDRLMRTLHLYTGLFLVPWMMVYAASAFCLNHGPRITETFGIAPPKWHEVRRVDFTPDDAFPADPEEQARALLRYLDLDGPYNIQGKPTPDRLVVFRACMSSPYRVTWQRKQSRLIVEQMLPFSYYRLMHAMHFQHGYHRLYPVPVIWAVAVDAVALSIVVWVISGIYLWARRPRRRLAGGVCLVAGILLFTGLAVLLSR